jgi:RNA polymerase sigma-70 factor, ECF subfamily
MFENASGKRNRGRARETVNRVSRDKTMTTARSSADLDRLLEQARCGHAESIGLLLDGYRNYLGLLARGLLGGTLRINLDASDLVQQTFLEAHRDLPKFRGTGEPELAAWLRRILVHNLSQQAEYHGRQKRGRKNRVSVDELLDRSGRFVTRARTQRSDSPSTCAVRREQAVLLADALARLPEDQRTALEMHHLQGLTVPEVSRVMGRSLVSVTALIYRGLKSLRTSFDADA